jgi:hypothetical protein
MKAVGVVEASCEAIFQLVMSMDTTRFEYIFCCFDKSTHQLCIPLFLTNNDFYCFSLCYLRWDCSFQYGSLVEEVDGHTAILYHRLQLDWFSGYVIPLVMHKKCEPLER